MFLDSCIMGSRMVIKLENILWVLTDMQMKAALHFLDSLSGLIQKATEIARKRKAARKLELLPEYQAQQSQHARAQEQPGVNQQSIKKPIERFGLIDVVETSYHFMADKIELHFSDDNSGWIHAQLLNFLIFSLNRCAFQLSRIAERRCSSNQRRSFSGRFLSISFGSGEQKPLAYVPRGPPNGLA